MFRSSYRLFVLILLTLSVPCFSYAQEVYINPSVVNTIVGASFDVNVMVRNVSSLSAFEFRVSFNKSVLEAVSISKGSLWNNPNYLWYAGDNITTIDNPLGMIDFTIGAASSETDPIGINVNNNGGSLATINFEVLAKGSSQITLNDVTISQVNGNIINAGVLNGYVNVTNTPPVASGLAITPISPKKSDDLVGSYTYTDADGDLQIASEIKWYKNNNVLPTSYTTLRVPSIALSVGDSWYFTVKPYDGKSYGILQKSPFSKINTPPVASNLAITPISPKKSNDLFGSYTYADANSDPQGASEIKWYKNSVLQTSYTTLRVPSSALSAGDRWYFTVKPYDGKEYGTLRTSSVVNTLPVASNLAITPILPKKSDDLFGSYTYADANSDPQGASEIKWYKNSVLQTSYTTVIVPSIALSVGDNWYFTVKPYDGKNYGELETSSTVNIKQPPVADNQSVTTNENTPINITLTANDIDGNTLTYTVVTSPANGILSGVPPNLTYTPKPNDKGPDNISDSFTFRASASGLDSNIATASITVTPVTRSITINLVHGLNIISCPGVPVISDIPTLTDGYKNIPSHMAFVYNPVTQDKEQTTTLEFGKCYFFETTASTQLTIEYYPRYSMSFPLKYNWNFIGSLSCSVPTNTLTLDPPIPISVMRWDAATQKLATSTTTIEPGGGYPILATADCTLTMNCPSAATPGNQILPTKPSWEGVVSIYNQKDHEELIFGMHKSASDGFDIQYDMPIPPFLEPFSSINAGWISDDPVFDLLSESYVRDASIAGWELSVTLTEPGVLSWRNLPNTYSFELLYDNQALDMHAERSLSLPIGEHRLRILLNDVPRKTSLMANYPNPFNPETWIPFELSKNTKVEIMIYSSSGQLVRRLDLGHKPAGIYIVRDKSAYWDGKNEAGESVSSGVYFYTLVTPEFFQTRKLVILR